MKVQVFKLSEATGNHSLIGYGWRRDGSTSIQANDGRGFESYAQAHVAAKTDDDLRSEVNTMVRREFADMIEAYESGAIHRLDELQYRVRRLAVSLRAKDLRRRAKAAGQ